MTGLVSVLISVSVSVLTILSIYFLPKVMDVETFGVELTEEYVVV